MKKYKFLYSILIMLFFASFLETLIHYIILVINSGQQRFTGISFLVGFISFFGIGYLYNKYGEK